MQTQTEPTYFECKTRKLAREAAANLSRYMKRNGGEGYIVMNVRIKGKWNVEVLPEWIAQFPNLFDVLTEGAY